jgi:hypothetical protein
MNAMSKPRRLFRTRALIAGMLMAAIALAAPHVAQAATADADSGQTVECMLPGQIHTIAGHATMGARQPVQTTPEDCRQRGGEYTVDEHASEPVSVPHVPVAAAADTTILNCLLPKQVRQLGEKVHYTTARRPIKTTRADCGTRGGDVISSAQARKAARDYRAAVAKQGTAKQQP